MNQNKSWPLIEASKIAHRVAGDDKPVIFETGYGPSGLPHIGTFAEVVRTLFVKRVFTETTGRSSKLIAFSDDMDALRRVPDNVPEQEMLNRYIGFPLTSVPDPYHQYDSFAHHNNAMLVSFLERYGFVEGHDYEFRSSTACYKNGLFNKALTRMAECHQQIVEVVRPTLGAERGQDWSPFMPIHPVSGKVMTVPILNISGTDITWSDGEQTWVTSILNGHAKVGWKADWALRWYALGVDYEMSGKDLIESVKLSSKICRILGGNPPINMTYELFLDKEGHKISKSLGNGLSIETWEKYASMESLAYFLFQKPNVAKKLDVTMIPTVYDDFQTHLAKLAGDELYPRNNPAWYAICEQNPQDFISPISMKMMLNLANVSDAEDAEVLLRFVDKFTDVKDNSEIVNLAHRAVRYYQDIMKGERHYKIPNEMEQEAIRDLKDVISELPANLSGEEFQYHVYEVGKRHSFASLRDWFKLLYETVFGQEDGPRFGHFIEVYGKYETLQLLDKVLKG